RASPREARPQTGGHDRDERHQPAGYRIRFRPQRTDPGDVRWCDRRLPAYETCLRRGDMGCRRGPRPHRSGGGAGMSDPPRPERIRPVEAQLQPEGPVPDEIAAAADTAKRVIENVARVIHAPRPLIERCVLAVMVE